MWTILFKTLPHLYMRPVKMCLGRKATKQMTAHPNIISLEMNGTIKIVLKQKKDFKKARNSFLKNVNDENKQNFISTRTKYNRVKRNAKHKYKLKEGKDICDLAKKKPKQFWKSIKKKYKQNQPQHPDDPVNINAFFEHFKEVYGGQHMPQDEQSDVGSTSDPDLDLEISDAEIREAILSQKNNKSSGIDNLTAESFKTSCDLILPFLSKLFNCLFTNGEYPSAWAEGAIVPIYKSKNPHDPNNYRGITLINIFGKIYSQILLNRLSGQINMIS